MLAYFPTSFLPSSINSFLAPIVEEVKISSDLNTLNTSYQEAVTFLTPIVEEVKSTSVIDTSYQNVIGLLESSPLELQLKDSITLACVNSLDVLTCAKFLESYPMLTHSFVSNAIQTVEQLLTIFALSEDISQKIRLALGDYVLLNQSSIVDFSSIPQIQIRQFTDPNGAFWEFSPQTNTIYLSQTYLEQNASNPQVIINGLIEELSHFISSHATNPNPPTPPNPPTIDLTPPNAIATATDITTLGGNTYDFTITYSDNVAVNAATLGSGDVLVTSSNGFNQLASLVSVNSNNDGSPITATYQINAPGGNWDPADNGTYSLSLQTNQVSDTNGNFTEAANLGGFVANVPPISASEQNIIFPSDAGVLNVKDFGAKGDGITDDTAAIQAALNAYPNGKRIIYLPNGTYLISNTLTWPAGTPGTGNDYKNTIMQGQSQSGVTIKLKDGAASFGDPNNPKTMIFTGPAPAQRFGNSIRTLTVDTGIGNAGAIGIQFNASNQGSMRQVTIQSGDGQGIVGLDFGSTDEIGPLLVKDVTIKGFQYGIRSGYTVNSQTFENITLQNQSVYGFLNFSQVVNIRNLTSTNAVTAIYNGVFGLSHMTLLNASLNGINGASSQSAIINTSTSTLLARDLVTTGYQSSIASGSTIITDSSVSEFVSKPVTSLFPSPAKTLNLPVKETPDVPWDNLNDWANVVSFGAIPNDGLDDTAAIQAAIDSGKTTVYLPVGNYNLQSTVFIRNNARRIIGTEAIVEVPNSVSPGFKVVDGTNPVVVFERIGSGYNSTPTIENASSRTLVIRDATNVSGNMTGSGDVFIENVVSNPFSSWTFNGQNVWARQFNVENQGTHITNNGANLWIFGLKTERGGTLIDTKNGGKTELLGGLAYTTTSAPDGTQNDPMFINNESSVSISLAEVNYGAPVYTTYVREIRGGVTSNLSGSSLPDYWGNGNDIPLYSGFQMSGTQPTMF